MELKHEPVLVPRTLHTPPTNNPPSIAVPQNCEPQEQSAATEQLHALVPLASVVHPCGQDAAHFPFVHVNPEQHWLLL